MGRFDSFKYCEYCGLEPSLQVEKKCANSTVQAIG